VVYAPNVAEPLDVQVEMAGGTDARISMSELALESGPRKGR
jgi:hypothetical protein